MPSFSSSDQTAAVLRLIRRWWWLPLLFGTMSALIAYAGTGLLMKPRYGASITFQALTAGNGGPGLIRSPNDANSYALLMTTEPSLSAARQSLDAVSLRDPTALDRTVCNADASDRFVTCTTTSTDYLAAAAVLNHLSTTFLAADKKQQDALYAPSLRGLQLQTTQLRSDIKSLQQSLAQLHANNLLTPSQQFQANSLQTQLSQDRASLSQLAVQESNVRTQEIQSRDAIQVVNPAVPNRHQISPHPLRNALLGLIVGIGIAATTVTVLEYLDDGFRSSDEVTTLTGLSMLGAIRRFDGSPEGLHLVTWTKPRSAFAEAYRVIRTNIEFRAADRKLTVLMITSARDGEGKTTTAANLAAAMAVAGRRVLLVDADLHRSGLSRLFGLADKPGLSTALLLEPAQDISLPTEVPNMRLVPSGPHPPNPAELLGSRRMREWLTAASERYDMVILDTPPILSVADTRIMTSYTDGVILVVSPSDTNRRLVRSAGSALEAVGAPLLGAIINKADFPSERYYYGYHYGRYGSNPKEDGVRSGSDPIELTRT